MITQELRDRSPGTNECSRTRGLVALLAEAHDSISGMKPLLMGLVLWFALAAASNGQSDGEWSNLRNMPSERQELATAVLNGKIYAIAGYTGTDFDVRSTTTVEVYNPATDTWSSAHDLPTPNNHHCAAVVA